MDLKTDLSRVILIYHLPEKYMKDAVKSISELTFISEKSIIPLKSDQWGVKLIVSDEQSFLKVISLCALNIHNRKYSLYSVVTDLIVYATEAKASVLVLQQYLEQHAPVLFIYNMRSSNGTYTGNFRVALYHPEIPNLIQHWTNKSNTCVYEGISFTISFFCPFCRKPGHFKSQCWKKQIQQRVLHSNSSQTLRGPCALEANNSLNQKSTSTPNFNKKQLKILQNTRFSPYSLPVSYLQQQIKANENPGTIPIPHLQHQGTPIVTGYDYTKVTSNLLTSVSNPIMNKRMMATSEINKSSDSAKGSITQKDACKNDKATSNLSSSLCTPVVARAMALVPSSVSSKSVNSAKEKDACENSNGSSNFSSFSNCKASDIYTSSVASFVNGESSTQANVRENNSDSSKKASAFEGTSSNLFSCSSNPIHLIPPTMQNGIEPLNLFFSECKNCKHLYKCAKRYPTGIGPLLKQLRKILKFNKDLTTKSEEEMKFISWISLLLSKLQYLHLKKSVRLEPSYEPPLLKIAKVKSDNLKDEAG